MIELTNDIKKMLHRVADGLPTCAWTDHELCAVADRILQIDNAFNSGALRDKIEHLKLESITTVPLDVILREFDFPVGVRGSAIRLVHYVNETEAWYNLIHDGRKEDVDLTPAQRAEVRMLIARLKSCWSYPEAWEGEVNEGMFHFGVW